MLSIIRLIRPISMKTEVRFKSHSMHESMVRPYLWPLYGIEIPEVNLCVSTTASSTKLQAQFID